jgi:hypothetical protein
MTRTEFIDKYDNMVSYLAIDRYNFWCSEFEVQACLCNLIEIHFNRISRSFKETFKPEGVSDNVTWFGGTTRQNQETRFIALQVFKQYCLSEKVYKDLQGK